MIEKVFKSAAANRLALPLSFVAGLTLLPQQLVADSGYAMSSSKGPVKSGTGLCWKAPGGAQVKFAECGDAIEQPATPEATALTAADSDRDGVPDDRDKCPDTPRGVKVDSMGCPIDTDGDGVPDYQDACPGTPAGAKIDANGCEIIASVTINLGVEEFDFDSAQLKPQMEQALDDVATKIKGSKGNEALHVVGHTDSTGPESYNMKLSERRAQSAANYLIGQGVVADRISVSGEGETNPIADNGTREGRAKNRRIEIRTQ